MIKTETVECPECGCDVDVNIYAAIDVKTAAHELIAYYKGDEVVSAGDAIKLEDAIRKCLVDDLGVSSSKVD